MNARLDQITLRRVLKLFQQFLRQMPFDVVGDAGMGGTKVNVETSAGCKVLLDLDGSGIGHNIKQRVGRVGKQIGLGAAGNAHGQFTVMFGYSVFLVHSRSALGFELSGISSFGVRLD